MSFNRLRNLAEMTILSLFSACTYVPRPKTAFSHVRKSFFWRNWQKRSINYYRHCVSLSALHAALLFEDDHFVSGGDFEMIAKGKMEQRCHKISTREHPRVTVST